MEKLILRESGVQFLSKYGEIGDSIEDRIEAHKDIIFILSPAEWKEWMKAYLETMQTIQGFTEYEQWQAIKSASESIELKLAPLFLMSFAPWVFGEFGILAFIPEDYYVVFFVREENRMEKADRVLESVRQYDERYGNDTPLFT